MLAMPVVWLTWYVSAFTHVRRFMNMSSRYVRSIIAFIGCIVWFMWRARAHLPDTYVFSATDKTDLGFRIFISVVLGIGAMYSLLIFTTFQRYGAQMEEKWTKRASSLLRKRLSTSLQEIARDPQPPSQKSQISAKLPQPPQTSNSSVFPAAPSPPGQYLTPQGWTAPAVQYFARAEAMSSRQSPNPSLASFDNHI